ncbi:MAG: virulence protein [Psychromonas sp.]
MFKISSIFSLITTVFVSFQVNATVTNISSERYNRSLPFLAQDAIDRGYELPKPYGFSFNYMKMNQPLIVDSVDFYGPNGESIDRVDINTSTAHQESETLTLRADAWVLPFLNLYGILGYTRGSSTAPVDVTLTVPSILPPHNDKQYSFSGDFPLVFDGPTYGFGATLVGGIGNWFAMVDGNYTLTNLNILDGEISSIVISPRVGYMTKYKQHNIQMWVGAMYQNVEQTFTGTLRDIGIGNDGTLGSSKFVVEQHLEEQWNSLIGAQVGLTPNIDLLMEAGIGKRSSFMVGLGYRF